MEKEPSPFSNSVLALFIGALIMGSILSLDAFLWRMHVGGGFTAAIFPEVLVLLANKDRSIEGASSLTVNPTLVAAAEAKAEDMATKGYFAHYSPDGKTPWYWLRQEGYQFVAAGENLAVNFDDSTALEHAWMLSPTHRQNLLSKNYTEIGIGMAEGIYKGRPATYVVEFFGRPAAE